MLGNINAQPHFLPVTEIPVFHSIPPQGYPGMTFQDGTVPFNPQQQGPMMFVDAMGQQHVTSVAFHPQLQAPLVAMGGTGPQYGVPLPYAPHLQGPIMYVDANCQQPFDPLLQARFMLVDGAGLPHGTSVPFDPYLQAPLVVMDAKGLQHRTTLPFNPRQIPSGPVQLIDNPQLPGIEELAAGLTSTGLVRPARVVKLPAQLCRQETKAPAKVAGCAPTDVPTVPLKPQATSSTEDAEVRKAQDGQPKAIYEAQPPGTSSAKDILVVEDAQAKPADKSASTKQTLKTAPVEVGKADTKPSKKPKKSLPENDDKSKDRKRKRKHDKGENERKEKRSKKVTTKTGEGEKDRPDTDKAADSSKAPGDKSKDKHKDSSKKSKSKKAKDAPSLQELQPRSRLGERMVNCVQVFHKLGDKIDKVKPPVSKPNQEEAAQKTPQKPQSDRPGSSGGQVKGQPRMPYTGSSGGPTGQPRIPYTGQPYRIPKMQRSNNVSDCAPVRSNADQARRPASTQSKSSAPPPERKVQKPTAPARRRTYDQVPHYFKNHAYGSVGDYGDGERVLYLRPEYPGMFPLPLINLPPLPPGAPRAFHCREYSTTITFERRAEREAMKREAKRNRDEAAKITRNSVDCSVLAERKHLPHEPWPVDDNWWENGLDDTWKFPECSLDTRDDVMFN